MRQHSKSPKLPDLLIVRL